VRDAVAVPVGRRARAVILVVVTVGNTVSILVACWARTVVPVVVTVGNTIAVLIARWARPVIGILTVRDAIAVTVPATGLEAPPLAASLRVAFPTFRHEPLTGANLLPAPGCPDVLIAGPRPMTGGPDEAG